MLYAYQEHMIVDKGQNKPINLSLYPPDSICTEFDETETIWGLTDTINSSEFEGGFL